MSDRTCALPDCDKPRTGRCLHCSMHRYRMRVHGSYDKPRSRAACKSGGCTAIIDPNLSKSGLCQRCKNRRRWQERRDEERERGVLWRAKNAEYDRQRRLAFYAANAEQQRQRSRDYVARNRALVLAKAAAWREANREDLRRRDRERRRNDPNWPLRNRENARRRLKAPDGSKVDYSAILTEHGMTCHICKTEIESPADLHMDHVIPLSRGGAHSAENIRPAHASCNMRKGARIIA